MKCEDSDTISWSKVREQLKPALANIFFSVLKNAAIQSHSVYMCLDAELDQLQVEQKVFVAASPQNIRQYHQQTNRRLFINLGTLEVYCFKCNIEILDESFRDVTLKNKEIIATKQQIRDCLKQAI